MVPCIRDITIHAIYVRMYILAQFTVEIITFLDSTICLTSPPNDSSASGKFSEDAYITKTVVYSYNIFVIKVMHIDLICWTLWSVRQLPSMLLLL